MRKLLYIFYLISLLLAAGCSVDEPRMMPGADGNTTINLLIPSSEMALANTRGVSTPHGDRLADEAKIHTLAVVGFNSNNRHFFFELTSDMAEEVDNVYRSYKLSVEPGTYSLYVFANYGDLFSGNTSLLNKLKADGEDTTLENTIKNLPYTFSSLPSTGAGLPMAGTASASPSEGQNLQVRVDLKFLCSKVRLTVIYQDQNASLAVGNHDAVKVAEKVSCFEGVNVTGVNYSTKTGIGSPVKYALNDEDKDRSFDNWVKRYENINDDPVEKLAGNGETSSETCFAWQNTVYLPENLSTSAENQTYLNLQLGGKTQRINIGCDSDDNSHNSNTGGQLKRGNFYDIVAVVKADGDITYSWKVIKWEAELISVQLAGISRLFLAKTKIDTVSGEYPVEFYYESDAPNLIFSSTQYDGKDLFQITEDKDNQVIKVAVHPDQPLGNLITAEGMGFWVISGSIQKFVAVTKVDLRRYLRLLPESNNVMIRNIVNEPSYSTYYEFSTNSTGLSLTIEKLSNDNTSKGYAAATGNDPAKGVTIQVLNADRSKALTEEKEFKTIADVNTLLATIPQDTKAGVIKITIYDPTDPDYFAKDISAEFKATADGISTPKKAELRISPNPTVYTIHFKAINDGTWSSPHIYVYQPLEYDGLPVYDQQKSGYDERAYNWLEYSFTGNRAFKGWKSDGGDIADLTGTPRTIYTADGTPVEGYSVDWNDGHADIEKDNYYTTVTLVDKSKSYCTDCQSSPKPSWPGMGMTKEEDGWWKIEIPLLAKPDKALVMFANDHSRKEGDYERQRYPGQGVPGIPLPNYSDREAWYLYDADRGGANCSFSDDRRDAYPALPEQTLVVRIPTNDLEGQEYLYFRDGKDNHAYFGDYNNCIKANGTKDGYIYWKVKIALTRKVEPAEAITKSNSSGTEGEYKYNMNGCIKETSSSLKKAYGADILYTVTKYKYVIKGDAFDGGWDKNYDLTWTGTDWKIEGLATTNNKNFGIVKLNYSSGDQADYFTTENKSNTSVGIGTYKCASKGDSDNNFWTTVSGDLNYYFNPITKQLTISR